MKSLYLIRHAKSSWAFDLNDHDRPLGPRGRNDLSEFAPKVCKQLKKPDTIVTSTASRALYTALHYADEWGYPETKIITEPGLFHADALTIMEIVKDYGNASALAIVGHNPGFTSFYNMLCAEYLENIPTCGTVHLHADIQNWKELKPNSMKRISLFTPKSI